MIRPPSGWLANAATQ